MFSLRCLRDTARSHRKQGIVYMVFVVVVVVFLKLFQMTDLILFLTSKSCNYHIRTSMQNI